MKPVEKKTEPLELTRKNVEVVREGNKIVLPEGMSLQEGRTWLERKELAEEEEIAIHEIVKAFPLEGALAFSRAMAQKYGFVDLVPTPGFWGPTPPVMIGIDIDVGKTAQVPWGSIKIPGLSGRLETSCSIEDNRMCFSISGTVKQKDADKVKELAELTRQFVETQSVYRGKAIRVRFQDPNTKGFNPSDCPRFIDVSHVRAEDLIFAEDVRKAVQVSVFTPIEKTQFCRMERMPLKRGILLEGPFGVGKTLTANVTAKKCIDNGWTFIYLETPKDLKQAIHFARAYQPAVIFAEDVDRVMEGNRNEAMDAILNTIDGVDTKNMELMVVLTTNHVERIEPAMLRPGRLDAVISVAAPDASAAVKLVRLYARNRLDPNDDLTRVGQKLAGQIPAVIREVVERSKLAAIDRTQEGNTLLLRSDDLLIAADQMLRHLELMQPVREDKRSDIEKAADVLGGHFSRTTRSEPRAPSNGKTATHGEPRIS